MVDEIGRIPTSDVDYTDVSPQLSLGMTCSNCIASGDNGCDWVAVSCTTNGWCKLNMVPVLIRSSNVAGAVYAKAKGDEVETPEGSEDDSSSAWQDFSLPPVKKDGEGMPAGGNEGMGVSNGPTVEGVHLDTPVWSDGRKRRGKKSSAKKIADTGAETLVTAKSADEDLEEIPNAIQKNAELRYTLGPWYVPNRHDAHGEWTDPEELQKALWGYVEHGDRDIRLQHNVDIVAGKWVEALTWPHEVEVPMVQADTGAVRKTSFPAGTVFLGVQWEPWAWDLVKKGQIRGYSIGGTGAGVEVDMPSDTAPASAFSAVKNASTEE